MKNDFKNLIYKVDEIETCSSKINNIYDFRWYLKKNKTLLIKISMNNL